MVQSRRLFGACSLVLGAVVGIVHPLALQAGQSVQSPSGRDALRIVVIDGEGAVNIIQQKTAVAPVVEVRDRNNQPVAGAIVRFAIARGRATFAGARTLTVATDVAGRAAVSGLTPGAAGSLQISATATFQGQSAAVMIAQTNVMMATEAATVSGTAGSTSGGAGGGTAGGASGGAAAGGGLSTTALVVAGAAVAAGAVATTKVLGGDDEYSGPLNFQMTETYGACGAVFAYTSTLKMKLTIDATNVSGKANWGGTRTFVSTTCTNLPGTAMAPINNFGWGQHDPTVGGSTSSITFHHEVSNRTDPANFTGDFGQVWDFTGGLNGTTITGTADYSTIISSAVVGRLRIPVNITKQ